MPKPPRPTEAEIAILGVLWRRGACTVREVLAEMPRGTGYTTILKLMQIMAEKGLVLRDESQRSHVYRAAAPQTQTLRRLAADLLERAFGGSAHKLMIAALAAKPATRAELAEMRRLIDEADKNEKGKS